MNSFESAKKYFLDGCAFLEAEDFSQAENLFLKSLELLPDRASTLTNLSAAQLKLKKYSEAKVAAEKAIQIEVSNSEAYLNLGLIEKETKGFESAIHLFDKALSLKPDYAEAWSNKGVTLNELKLYDQAISHYDKALSLKPDYAEAWSNKGVTLNELKLYDQAISHYDKALSLKPDYAEAWSNKGVTLNELKLYDQAISHYDKALSLKPEYAEAWSNKATTLNFLKKHPESAKCYLKALDLKVGESYLLGEAHHQMMLACDWTDYEKIIEDIFKLTEEGRMGSYPFGFQGIAISEELLKKCAVTYSGDKYPALNSLAGSAKYIHGKLRIGYLCGEFRNQATSILMTRIWELHDKEKFEIFAFDSGWDDGSEYRQRINKAFGENMFDISRFSDLKTAHLIQSNEIDILVNLNGFFGQARQGVFSYKPAPIQVNYLGFPGTIGSEYMDYIIADKIVIPEESQKHYVEKVVYLPNTYQANDNQRQISEKSFSRTQLGLPKDAFVFACFNNNYKITPTTFDSWMQILKSVEGSVLWLLADNPMAQENLIKEAAARGINSSRLIFADRMPIAEHLARHRQADLFLDTLPYNAHTTTSDALWAGLPLLTLIGQTFPGRVAASLLSAAGLSELITYTEEEYESLAIELASNRRKLDVIKENLAKNRLAAPLFDTDRFSRHLEDAYIKMCERYQLGLQADHISII